MKFRKGEYFQKLLWMPVAAVVFTCFIYLVYMGTSTEFQSHPSLTKKTGLKFNLPIIDNLGRPLEVAEQAHTQKPSYDEIIEDGFKFNIRNLDVMVFLHIQKTGGTVFGKHLVHDLDLKKPCHCRKNHHCKCFRPNTRFSQWLFSRYSTGWKCGVHADWTELTHCVDGWMKKQKNEKHHHRYFYISMIRNPIDRYISEFRHVQRGAIWRQTDLWCGGRKATEEELPKCYSGENWKSVSFDEFLACESNLANNRQTMMLADLAIVGCYNKTLMAPEDRNAALLESAKSNLAKMAFFGVMEQQKLSQFVFEESFNLRFRKSFKETNHTRYGSNYKEQLTAEQMERIKERNALDLELYEFGVKLLVERFRKLNYNYLGGIATKYLNSDIE